MDSSWLHEEVDVDSLESGKSDSEEVEHELESRLYSIVHHNDLSQQLPAELSQHYTLQHSDNGEVTVTLNQTLEQLKCEEAKHVNEVLEGPESVSEIDAGVEKVMEIPNDDEDNDVVIVSEVLKCKHSNKRFRYSDVNIDQGNKPQKSNNSSDNFQNVKESIFADTSCADESMNVEDVYTNLLLKDDETYKEFSDIKFPPLLRLSDWKTNSNASFIPIESSAVVAKPIFKNKFIRALKDANPDVTNKKLRRLVDLIFQTSVKNVKPTKKLSKIRKLMRKNLINGLDIMTNFELKSQNGLLENRIITNIEPPYKKRFHDSLPDPNIFINVSPTENTLPTDNSIKDKQNSRSKKRKKINGSVSLKSSPFRPIHLLTEIGSKDLENLTDNELKSSNHSTKISLPYIPTKWTKKMTDFYTKPSNKKIQKDIAYIFQKFDKSTSAEDWLLNPLDETGVYHRHVTGKKKPLRRCMNCKQRDHSAQNCPEPKKRIVCFLCGDYNHFGYNCHKRLCWKCGVHASEGECQACYFQNFESNSTCERCGSALHRTLNCPDSWRSFHSTIEGAMKIPEEPLENRRRWCCNCARRGHFSHNCPSCIHTGQQINPFVTNYSDTTVQPGTTEIFFTKNFGEILSRPQSDQFLQSLSTTSNAVISVDHVGERTSVTVNGTFEQCMDVKSKIQEYVNTKKRKRNEPPIRRKRQRLK